MRNRKSFVMAVLVLCLGAAVYLNWQFSNSGEDLVYTGNITSGALDATDTTPTDGEGDDEGDKNYGDVKYVIGDEAVDDDYFAMTRIDRDKAREEAIDTVQEILSSANIDSAGIEEAAKTATNIAMAMESESKIEATIKAKGFNECVVFIDEEFVTAVVQSEGLTAGEAAVIKDAVLSSYDTAVENIRIVEVK